MRSAVKSLAIACTLLFVFCTLEVNASPPQSGAYHLVLPRRAVGAGERVELRLEPPAPAGLTVNYWVRVGTGGIGMNPYRAPYVIPPGTPPATVSASFSGQGVRASVSTEIELLPGSVPGAEDCLGPGQSFSTVYGAILPEYTPVDELPELIRRVEPDYPRSAVVRGIEATIHCNALVCRSGRVLDAVALQRQRGTTASQPIEDDPKLVEAAIAAVKQYLFKPGMVSGHPVAVWVTTPVVFRR